jgi:hypothetical protein
MVCVQPSGSFQEKLAVYEELLTDIDVLVMTLQNYEPASMDGLLIQAIARTQVEELIDKLQELSILRDDLQVLLNALDEVLNTEIEDQKTAIGLFEIVLSVEGTGLTCIDEWDNKGDGIQGAQKNNRSLSRHSENYSCNRP